MPKFVRAAVSTVCAAALVSPVNAQRGAGDWMTTGNDPQRSSWVRNDGKISVATMSKPGFEMVWKVKLNATARQLNSLTPPALLDFYIGYRGFRALGFFGGSGNNVTGVDIDIAHIEWQKTLGPAGGGAGTIPCPGGSTSGVARPTTSSYPPPAMPRGAGRATPAKSGVGEPFEGAVTLRDRRPPPPPPPAPAKPARNAAPAINPYAPRIQWVNVISSDGKLHSLYASNGDEPNPPVAFLPANANAVGLMVVDGVAYAATANNCGGTEDAVWALNLESKQVSSWKAGAPIAGSMGPAMGPEGTVYAAAGSELTALESGTLKKKESYKADQPFTSSPLVFEYKGKNLIAAASSDGRLHLADADSLGKALDRSEAFSTPNYAAGALASWQDAGGTRWVLAPAAGAIVAWKVVDRNGAPAFEKGWTSRELVSPLTPAVVNGVVFALSSGEFRGDAKMTAAQRAQKSAKAILYALDGGTGKELWNSGAAISSFVHSGGLAAGGGRVYVGAHDGTQYTFSFPMEH